MPESVHEYIPASSHRSACRCRAASTWARSFGETSSSVGAKRSSVVSGLSVTCRSMRSEIGPLIFAWYFFTHGSQPGEHAVVPLVERVEDAAMADGRRGNQCVKQAETLRKMKLGELFECRLAFRLGWPHDLKAIDKRESLLHLVRVSGVLHELHHHEAGYADVAIRREPICRGGEATLDIDQHIRVDELHGLDFQPAVRRWAASRRRRELASGSVMSVR